MAKNTDKTILVTGATGHQGGAVFRYLREKGFPVRALTRDPDSEQARSMVGHGVEVLRGDLSEPATLSTALDDVFGVYSVQSGAEEEIKQANTLSDAANRANVSHFVYSSSMNADSNSDVSFFASKGQIENHLRGTGLQYTILRPVSFMENWLAMREQIEQQGRISLPLKPETKLWQVSVDDIGAFAGMAFEKPGAWQGRTVPLAGDELSMVEIAEAFSRKTGREVQYEQMPWEQAEKMFGHDATQMYRNLDNSTEAIDIGALRQEHSSLLNFERWLNTKWRAGAQAVAGS